MGAGRHGRVDTGERGAAVREFAGEFEIHLTVVSGFVAGDEDRLRRWAERHRVKYTRIVLDRGATPDQPMLTVGGRGVLSALRAAASVWVERLRAEGFGVGRVKIEATPWNEDVPRTTAEARALPPGCHFEHHVKLALADDAEVATVRAVAERHSAHVSRNARRARGGRGGGGGRGHERFVTQRCRDVGRPEARRRLDALLDALTAAGFEAVEVEEEFVVHDDRPALDSGWIDEGTTPDGASVEERAALGSGPVEEGVASGGASVGERAASGGALADERAVLGSGSAEGGAVLSGASVEGEVASGGALADERAVLGSGPAEGGVASGGVSAGEWVGVR